MKIALVCRREAEEGTREREYTELDLALLQLATGTGRETP